MHKTSYDVRTQNMDFNKTVCKHKHVQKNNAGG